MPLFNLAGRDTIHQPFLQGKTYDHSYLRLVETDDCNTVSQLHPLRSCVALARRGRTNRNGDRLQREVTCRTVPGSERGELRLLLGAEIRGTFTPSAESTT